MTVHDPKEIADRPAPGLSEAETWFGDNAQAGDNNTMYFLSDGRPITSFENGAYVEQDPSQFLDEVATAQANVDELITVHPSPTIEARLRSVDLTADALDPVTV